MADGNVTAKAMTPPPPEEFLAQLRGDFLNTAAVLENEADAAEDAMLQARARAGTMRAAAAGIGEALERFQKEVAHAHELRSAREDRGVPSKSGYAVKIPPEGQDFRAY